MSGRWMRNVAGLRRVTGAVSVTLLLSLGCTSLPATAADKSVDCTPPTYEGQLQLFKRTFEEAKATAAVLCDAIQQQLAGAPVDGNLLESHLLRLQEVAGEELASKQLYGRATYTAQLEGLETRFTNPSIRNLILPEFVINRAFGEGPSTGRFNGVPEGISAIQITDAPACEALARGGGCVAVLEDFGEAFNAYREPYESLYDNTLLLDELSADWERFLQVSRSQTFVEVLLTTQLNRKHFQKKHLVGPPAWQVIVLHPDLAYTYVKSNPDGQNDGMGLSIEWLGINFWDWPVPLGASVASLYFDKAGIKDVGIGVQLHAWNRLSVGWSRNGSKNVFYANLDLLKLFEEKGQKYRQYLDAYF